MFGFILLRVKVSGILKRFSLVLPWQDPNPSQLLLNPFICQLQHPEQYPDALIDLLQSFRRMLKAKTVLAGGDPSAAASFGGYILINPCCLSILRASKQKAQHKAEYYPSNPDQSGTPRPSA
ncbi:hypothetical protein [Marinithermofilum abyssi]|uniref:hypothetical protein n=1 Tax=Marinithermofilum abyssi TaxID=1571185 RepID=UPI001663AF09|nr:hypothetical protein [Marinithermofilum abyssi]